MFVSMAESGHARSELHLDINRALAQIDVNKLGNPNWVLDVNELEECERGEAERVADCYGNLTDPATEFDVLWTKIIMAAKDPAANLRVVIPEQMSDIDNFEEEHAESLEQTIEYLESKPRDWRSILKAFEAAGNLSAPVVIVLPNGVNHLMSGNSRLMMCRAIGKPARVLFVTM